MYCIEAKWHLLVGFDMRFSSAVTRCNECPGLFVVEVALCSTKDKQSLGHNIRQSYKLTFAIENCPKLLHVNVILMQNTKYSLQ